MIKLKGLIKEEIRHACECGGDCCKTTVNDNDSITDSNNTTL